MRDFSARIDNLEKRYIQAFGNTNRNFSIIQLLSAVTVPEADRVLNLMRYDKTECREEIKKLQRKYKLRDIKII